MPAPVIEVADLRKSYGVTLAVRDVSFEVGRGEILGILGPNGAGKTTTVETLTGLRTADGGRVRVLGLDPQRDRAELRRRVGVQLQDGELPPKITVAEALDLFASFHTDPADGRELAAGLGLGDKLATRYRDLSGGQQQRLAIALALVGRPEIAVLDELTTGLDPQARREVWDLIARVRDSGVTIVLVTHFMDEAERLCDRVVVIDDGRVVASGTPAGLAAAAPRGQVLRLRLAEPGDLTAGARLLAALSEVSEVATGADEIVLRGRADLVVAAVRALDRAGMTPVDVDVQRTSLEDAFVHLVGDDRPRTPEPRPAPALTATED